MFGSQFTESQVHPIVYLAQRQAELSLDIEELFPEVDFPAAEVVKVGGEVEIFSPTKLFGSILAAYLEARVASKFGSNVLRMQHLDDEMRLLLDDDARREIKRLNQEVTADLAQRLESGRLSTLGIRESVISSLHRLEPLAAQAYVAKRILTVDPQLDDGELRVVRRNNQVTPFNVSKIQAAVAKALLANGDDPSPATMVANDVAARIREERPTFVHIEVIQDYVQSALMKNGFYRVAERYIAYRTRRALMREWKRTSVIEGFELEDERGFDPSLKGFELIDDRGRLFHWDPRELELRLDFALTGLSLPHDREDLRRELLRSVRAGMPRKDFDRTVMLNAKSMLEKDPEYSLLAARILLTHIYEEVLGWSILTDGVSGLKEKHERYFVANYFPRAIKLDLLNTKLSTFDLNRLASTLDPTSDLQFDYLSIQTLYDRYLLVDRSRKPNVRIETPQIMWLRIAMGLCIEETERETRAAEIYDLYRRKLFCSSTPTLFNSGMRRSQLSSCFLYQVQDSIESIMIRGIAENAYLCKYAGGLGGSWTQVRGAGAYIKGTNGYSTGVIPFLKIHNDQLVAVNQGGKRKGVGCAYLEVWHSDIFEFLELRRNTGDERRRTHDMNTANWIPDLFMQRLNDRGTWTLFHSNEVADLHDLYGSAFKSRYEHYEQLAKAGKIFGREVQALDLWKKMLAAIFETGHPWFTFKDPCNIRSPQDHVGVIHSSNLCTEITLNTSEEETAVCNLGSLVLPSFFENGELNRDLMRSTIRLAVRALDNVIDINYYSAEPARRSNLRHRPVGLGVMGLQDVLFLQELKFDSPEAVEFTDELFEFISYCAYEASSDLAVERGKYSTYEGSKWDRGLLPLDTIELLEKERGETVEVNRNAKLDWESLREKIQRQGMRNSNVLAIAPTATISSIMTSVPCIEPVYKHMFVESNLSGNFITLNRFLVQALKKLNLWDKSMVEELKYYDGHIDQIARIPESIKERFATAFDIDPLAVIRLAAVRQKWIDQSQSVNIFTSSTDMKTLSQIYKTAWKSGLKTTYYLRTMAASGIDKATVSKASIEKREASEEEKRVCSLEAARNGEDCEACQ